MTDPIVATVKVSAVAEVRDADGNLISAEPISAEFGATQQQLDDLEGKD